MKVRILRVIGYRGHNPGVLAFMDDHKVEWKPSRGWTCTCDEPDGASCPHVDRMIDLLAYNTFGPIVEASRTAPQPHQQDPAA